MVPPKWTSGPYCPTELPHDIDKIDAIDVKKPDLTFNSSSSLWTDKMTSGGPCHLFPLVKFLIIPTKSPTKNGIIKKKKIIFMTNSFILKCCWLTKSVKSVLNIFDKKLIE